MEIRIEQSQKQILSQNMVQSMEILQMSAQELEGYIENLSMENPTIELEDSRPQQPGSKTEDLQRKLDWLESTDLQNRVYYQQERDAGNSQDFFPDKERFQEDLREYLMPQLLFGEYTQKQRSILEFLVQSLDDRGYFKEELSFVAQYFSVSTETVEELLRDLQSLDPAGVGARDLKECLLLQLRRRQAMLPELEISLAEQIVLEHMEEMAKNHLQEIAKKLRVSMEAVDQACREIRTLNPKPGSTFNNREQLRYISPDAVVVNLKDTFEILINEYQYPRFSISSYYRQMEKSTQDTEAKEYLQKKIHQAEWVSHCISQRSATLLKVMHVLVEKQYSFFKYGMGHKKPMHLADIAKELELHESTVSRAMRGKYLQCAWGVFPLNYFLTWAAAGKGPEKEEKTQEQIKQLIQQVVKEEDRARPYSDQAISEKLRDLGVEISRRTVNKYRTEMNIPDKSGRKCWKGDHYGRY